MPSGSGRDFIHSITNIQEGSFVDPCPLQSRKRMTRTYELSRGWLEDVLDRRGTWVAPGRSGGSILLGRCEGLWWRPGRRGERAGAVAVDSAELLDCLAHAGSDPTQAENRRTTEALGLSATLCGNHGRLQGSVVVS